MYLALRNSHSHMWRKNAYIYIYIEREREREKRSGNQRHFNLEVVRCKVTGHKFWREYVLTQKHVSRITARTCGIQ